MVQRVHIVIVEPSSIIRCGIVTLLQRASMSNVTIAESSDFNSLSSLAISDIPDLLIVNPSHVGQFNLSQLKSDLNNENLKIIALQSAFTDRNTLNNYDDVITIYDNLSIIRDKISNLVKDDSDQGTRKDLSVREKEIIVCVVKGMTNKQIADKLILSTHTVIAHRRNIANKLQIHSPSGLTIYAIVNKLVNMADIQNSISQITEDGGY